MKSIAVHRASGLIAGDFSIHDSWFQLLCQRVFVLRLLALTRQMCHHHTLQSHALAMAMSIVNASQSFIST